MAVSGKGFPETINIGFDHFFPIADQYCEKLRVGWK